MSFFTFTKETLNGIFIFFAMVNEIYIFISPSIYQRLSKDEVKILPLFAKVTP